MLRIGLILALCNLLASVSDDSPPQLSVACPVYKMADLHTVYIDELLGRQWLYSGAATTGMLGS